MAEQFDAVVNVSADTSKAQAEVTTLQQRLRGLSATKLHVQADIAKAKLEVEHLKRIISLQTKLNVDTSEATRKLATVRKRIEDLGPVKLKANVDTLQARAQIASLNSTINVKVNADRRGIVGIENSIKSADKAGRTFSSTIAQVISGSTRFLASVPAPIIAITGAVLASQAAVAATATAVGGLVVGFGAVAAVALASNTRVSNAFKATASSISSDFTLLASELVPTFVGIADRAKTAFNSITPDIRRMVSASGPLLDRFLGSLLNAATNAIPGFATAIERSGPIVEGISRTVEKLGTTAGNALISLTEDADGTGSSIEKLGDFLSGLIETTVDVVQVFNELAGVFGKIDDGVVSIGKNVDKLGGFLASLGSGGKGIAGESVANTLNAFNRNPSALAKPHILVSELLKGKGTTSGTSFIPKPRTAADAVANVNRAFGVSATVAASQESITAYEAWKKASKSLTEAERNEANVRTQNSRSEAGARRSVADAQTGIIRAQEAALRQIATAEKAVQEAQKNTTRAQLDLTRARKEAAQALADMQSQLRDLPDTEEGARIRLERAKLAAQEAGLTPGQTFTSSQLADRAKVEQDLRKREALLDLKNAEEAYSDVLRDNSRTREEVAEAERLGIENAPSVLDAKERLTAAIDQERESEQALRDTRVAAADAVAAANGRLNDAVTNLNETLTDNTARAAEAAARTKELSDEEAKAKIQSDILAAAMGLTTDGVGKYIDKVASVDPLVLELIGASELLDGLDAVAVKIRSLQLLAQDPSLSPQDAVNKAGDEISASRSPLFAQMQKFLGFNRRSPEARAMGGPIHGPGTGTSDEVPIWASHGEYMQPASAVQHYGAGFMEAVRKKKFPKFAEGGMIGSPLALNVSGMKDTLEKGGIYDRAKKNAEAYFTMGLGKGIGLGSSSEHSFQSILNVARRFDPNTILTSGLRFTDQGYHSKGMAADLVGNMQAIAQGFFGVKGSLLQLIHSTGRGYYVGDGRDVGGTGYYDAKTRAEHADHVHVAARKDAMESLLRGVGTGGSVGGDVGSWIAQAIGYAGVNDSWISPLHRRIMFESSGNPNAINLYDSNAQAGHPSRGLMQTIPSTFNAYRDPRLPNNIVDPVANIVAGINYIKARYGSIFSIDPPTGGYKEGGQVFDEGGMLAPGRTVVYNNTGKPEPLLNAAKELDLSQASIMQLARILAQILAARPAQLMLPDGKVLAESVSDSMMPNVTITGVF